MDITTETALKIISKFPKGSWHYRYWVSRVNEEISEWRLTAMENPKTELANLCTKNANDLEKRLNDVISLGKE